MLSKKVQSIKPSATLALAAKAKELQSKGFDVISLAVGEPDWDTFQVAKKEAIRSIEDGFTKYTPANGIEDLRKIIAEIAVREYGVTYAPNQVTVSIGGKYIIYSALYSILDPGNEVIVPAPYWVSYPTIIEMLECKPVIVNCPEQQSFKMTPAQLEAAITPNTKCLILNSPSNPTGAVYSTEELQGLIDVLLKHPHVFVLSDDIYNRLIFSENEFSPNLLQIAPELKDRIINVNGAAKMFSMTGWRVGWALAHPSIISAMSNFQSQTVSCAVSFAQKAVAKALLEGGTELKVARLRLRERRDAVLNELKTLPMVSAFPPDGAFYVWLGVKRTFGKSFNGQKIANATDFSKFLLDDQKVAVVPGIEFGSEGFVRMSFAIEMPRMKEAIVRIGKFLGSLT